MLERGCLQVYTGNGKGKTTAALGLALRAAGAGLRVYIAQFVKGMDYSELKSIQHLSEWITLKQFGRGCFIRGEPTDEDVQAARAGLAEAQRVMESDEADLLILDEANIATHFNLFSIEELLDLIDNRPPTMELVITGRNADNRVIERADLVTEMNEVKHYYNKGLQARKGIES